MILNSNYSLCFGNKSSSDLVQVHLQLGETGTSLFRVMPSTCVIRPGHTPSAGCLPLTFCSHVVKVPSLNCLLVCLSNKSYLERTITVITLLPNFKSFTKHFVVLTCFHLSYSLTIYWSLFQET